MDFTTDKLRSLVRKWQSLIECAVDVKTTDNYQLRLFVIGAYLPRPTKTILFRRDALYAPCNVIPRVLTSPASSGCERLADGETAPFPSAGFTKKRPNQVKRTTYAQSAQIRQIRKKMVEIVTREASSCDIKELVQKLIPDSIGKEIEKAAGGIFPMQNVYVRKCKILKAPKLDITKLMEARTSCPSLTSCSL